MWVGLGIMTTGCPNFGLLQSTKTTLPTPITIKEESEP